ncbi:hypothetical protein ACKLNR_012089 [Fusarium oxysporum f. sp. zingiberi]
MSPSRKVIKLHLHITSKKAIATNKPTLRHRTIVAAPEQFSKPLLVVCCYTTPNTITRLATLFQTQGAAPSHSLITTKSNDDTWHPTTILGSSAPLTIFTIPHDCQHVVESPNAGQLQTGAWNTSLGRWAADTGLPILIQGVAERSSNVKCRQREQQDVT